jgi:hypothetical protein
MTFSCRLWLCLPPAALAVLDGILTLCGQSSDYWSGDFSAVCESNPLAWVFLRWHPLAFVLGLAAWTLAILFAGAAMPRLFAVPVLFTVFVVHSLGGASWLVRYGGWGWVLGMGLLIAAERVLALTWRKARVGEITFSGEEGSS